MDWAAEQFLIELLEAIKDTTTIKSETVCVKRESDL